jgi:hypothetical protein
MLVVSGLDGGTGPQRWATARQTALAFLHAAGPVTLELVAGHGLPGDQALSVSANGLRLERRRLPRLPATDRFTVLIPARNGWNEIKIAYDAVAPAPAVTETPLLATRTRARSPVTPSVRFDSLRLVE